MAMAAILAVMELYMLVSRKHHMSIALKRAHSQAAKLRERIHEGNNEKGNSKTTADSSEYVHVPHMDADERNRYKSWAMKRSISPTERALHLEPGLDRTGPMLHGSVREKRGHDTLTQRSAS